MIGAREIPYALTSFLNKKEKIGADELFLELNNINQPLYIYLNN